MRIRSQSKLRYAWAFAIFWNLVAAPATFLGAVPAIQKGQSAAWIALIFPFAGAALLIWAARLSLRFLRFGASWIDLEGSAMLGGTLRARLGAARLPEQGSVLLTLSCINRTVTGSGDDRSTWEKVVWQEEQSVASEERQPGPEGPIVPVSFRLPFDAPPTRDGNPRDRILWRLQARARLAGIDYDEQFEIPVAAGPPGKQPDSAQASARPAASATERPAASRIVVEKDGRTVRFRLGAARNVQAALVCTFYACLFTGGMTLFILLGRGHGRDPLFSFFFWVFGLIFVPFSLLTVLILLHTALVSSRVTIDGEGVTVACSMLGIPCVARAARSEVRDVTLHVGMQVGLRPYYDLKLIRAEGRPLTIPAMLRDKREAEWLASEIKKALR